MVEPYFVRVIPLTSKGWRLSEVKLIGTECDLDVWDEAERVAEEWAADEKNYDSVWGLEVLLIGSGPGVHMRRYVWGRRADV